MLLGTMILLWVILLHLPRIIASPRDAYEWTNVFQALAISASAFVIVRSLKKQEVVTVTTSKELKHAGMNPLISKLKKDIPDRIPQLDPHEHARLRGRSISSKVRKS